MKANAPKTIKLKTKEFPNAKLDKNENLIVNREHFLKEYDKDKILRRIY